MSLNGIATFARNLDTLMASETFQKADDGERLRLSYALLNSRYGLGRLGVVRTLDKMPDPKLVRD